MMEQQPNPQEVPLVDPGNPFLGNSQASIAMGYEVGPQPVVIFTIRSGGATMTLKLTSEMVDSLTQGLQAQKAQLGTGLLIPNGPVDLSALGKHAAMTERLRNGH